METLIIMLKNVLIFVLLAAPGYLLAKKKLVKAEDTGILSCLLANLGMPFLIFSSCLSLEFTPELTKSMLVIGLLSFLFWLITFLLSPLFVPKYPDKKRRDMVQFCMVFANTGFMGIPLAQAMFGGGAPVAYTVILTITMNLVMFTMGVYLVSGDKKTIRLKKILLTPAFLAFILGIALNLLHIPARIPEIKTYSNYLSGIVTPLSMLILGIKLSQVPLKRLFASPMIYRTSLVRLVIFPILGMAGILLLRGIPFLAIDRDMLVGFFIGIAMPTASLSSAFADQYGGDDECAALLVLGTTVLCVVSIPVLYWLLGYFL